jgi:hypothetical protein
VKYELNSYILFKRVSKNKKWGTHIQITCENSPQHLQIALKAMARVPHYVCGRKWESCICMVSVGLRFVSEFGFGKSIWLFSIVIGSKLNDLVIKETD